MSRWLPQRGRAASRRRRREAPRRDGSGAATRPVRRRTRHGAAASDEAPSGPIDGGVIASTAILAGLGVVMVYSATAPLSPGAALPAHFLRHLAAVGAGIVCAAVATRIPAVLWRRLALPLWAAAVILLAATSVAGVEVNGARRWLAVPGLGLRFQAAEFAKWATLLAVIAVTAGLRERGAASRRPVVLAACLTLPPVVLLLTQPDFGSAAVLATLVGLVLFVAGVPLRQLLLPAGGAALAGVGFIATHSYALARLRGFLDPWERAAGEGFQLVQSFVAFGRGGSFGVGLGDGRQKLYYLPEAHTDFVLSVVAEELGLVGVLVVLGSFAALVVAGTRVASRARDPFSQVLAFAMTALIALPGAINAAVVMGVLPTTGFTLPFLSFGANSLIVCSLALGILLRISAREGAPRRDRIASAVPRGLVSP